MDYYEDLADGDENNLIKYSAIINDLSYDLSKASIANNLISIGLYFLYFVVFQRYNNGQTIGKKLLKLEVVDDEETVSFKKLLIRGIILYPMLFELLDVIIISILSKSLYIRLSTWISLVKYICFLGCFLPILIGKRGLHDKLANTDVIVVGSEIYDEGKATKWQKTAEKEKEIKKYRVNHTSGKRKDDK